MTEVTRQIAIISYINSCRRLGCIGQRLITKDDLSKRCQTTDYTYDEITETASCFADLPTSRKLSGVFSDSKLSFCEHVGR